MAANVWIGKQQARAQVITGTVVYDAATAYTATINGQDVSVAAGVGGSADGVCAALAAAAGASLAGEWAELTVAATGSGGTYTITGPADGAPIGTVTAGVSGGAGTHAVTTTTAAKSPHDINDGANWSLGTVPVAADSIVYENSAVDCLYNQGALAAVAITRITRRATFTGRIGLPDYAATGYREYRAKELASLTTDLRVEYDPADQAGQFRFNTGAANCAVTVFGESPASLGEEPVEWRGTGTNTLSVNGGGLAVAPAAELAATVSALTAAGAAVRVGPLVTLTTITLSNCEAEIRCAYTTLTMLEGGTVSVREKNAGTTTVVESGLLVWASTQGFGNLTVGSDGVVDLSQCPAGFAPGAIVFAPTATFFDPYKRLTQPYTISAGRWGLQSVNLNLGENIQITIG